MHVYLNKFELLYGGNAYNCLTCKERMPYSEGQIEVHLKDCPWVCFMCNMTFKTVENVEIHQGATHKNGRVGPHYNSWHAEQKRQWRQWQEELRRRRIEK